MFLYSNIIGSIFLATEAMLAYFAFASLDSLCVEDKNDPSSKSRVKFPCKVSDLYNENFLDLPGIGQICNFYPMLNIAAVPILNITLRNNLLDVIPVKAFLKKRNCCTFLLQDHRNVVKGVWSIILSLPVFIVVLVTQDVQGLITYTGGFCGAFIMLIFPTMLVQYGRRMKSEESHKFLNINKSPFQSTFWIYFVYFWAGITISSVIVKTVTGQTGE
mmetsp:Transcript_972/g.1737  ORF Transcript_972/g.1737 Transcript_972/m.1737 type:complete len:217 (+) Transcript_972:1030-1680(+)